LLADADVEFGIVRDYGMQVDDAELVVVLAASMHDIGMSIHRSNHEQYSLMLAAPKIRQLLAGIYAEPELTIIASETLHAIISHRSDMRGLTAEAGCVKVADALDMAEGRSRIGIQTGKIDVHSLSAAAINTVTIHRGEHRPIGISISMNNSAGIFQLDELLKPKITTSGIAQYVEVRATIEGETERRLLPVYNL
jgi:metal-dependent HD superfamily phosphatase/phosphodiesterase